MKLLCLMAYLTLAIASESYAFDHSHKAWDTLLSTHVNEQGQVNYEAWKKQEKPLDAYLSSLQSVSKKEFASWSANEQKAFLINAYNAFTVRLILNHYPVKSIRDIGSFFTKPWSVEFFSLLEGDIKTLDPIEHDYLRKKPEYKDPRIHAAVNCASHSCPKLQRSAFIAAKLDEQLTQATQSWLADSSKNRYDAKAKEMHLSKIFDWFDEDFGGNEQGVIKFVQQYGPEKARQLTGDIDVDYLDYDWSLNKQ